MGEWMAIVRVLEGFKVALPDRDLEARKEDVLTLPLNVAFILSRAGKVDLFSIYEEGKYLEGNHDVLGDNTAENMADVEG